MSSQLRLDLADAGSDPERLEELTEQLRRELLELDVEGVARPTSGQAPEGSRAFELMAAGALLVSFESTREAVTSLVSTVRGWLRRSPDPKRTLRLQLGDNVIELTGHTGPVEEQLVAEFLRAVTPPPSAPSAG